MAAHISSHVFVPWSLVCLPRTQPFPASSPQTQRAAGNSRECRTWETGTASRPRWLSARWKDRERRRLRLVLTSLTPSVCCGQAHSHPRGHLEQIECWVEHPLDDLFQELLEHAVLIDASLVYPEVIDELHPDHALHGVLGELPQLLVAVLPRAELQPIRNHGLVCNSRLPHQGFLLSPWEAFPVQ